MQSHKNISKKSSQKSRCTHDLPAGPCQSFHTYHRNGKGRGCVRAADKLPVLYLIFRAWAGVDARVGRAYGVRDF